MSSASSTAASFHIAQLNIANFLTSRDAPEVKGFMDALDEINALAEQSRGFVWRLQDEAGDATGFNPYGDGTIVNMSVWQDIKSLHDFTYRTAHAKIMARRKEWFHMPDSNHLVLWWVPAGHQPSIEEAVDRLEALQTDGASPLAFTFKQSFEPNGLLIGP